jgi:hypothetical protein
VLARCQNAETRAANVHRICLTLHIGVGEGRIRKLYGMGCRQLVDVWQEIEHRSNQGII